MGIQREEQGARELERVGRRQEEMDREQKKRRGRYKVKGEVSGWGEESRQEGGTGLGGRESFNLD